MIYIINMIIIDLNKIISNLINEDYINCQLLKNQEILNINFNDLLIKKDKNKIIKGIAHYSNKNFEAIYNFLKSGMEYKIKNFNEYHLEEVVKNTQLSSQNLIDLLIISNFYKINNNTWNFVLKEEFLNNRKTKYNDNQPLTILMARINQSIPEYVFNFILDKSKNNISNEDYLLSLLSIYHTNIDNLISYSFDNQKIGLKLYDEVSNAFNFIEKQPNLLNRLPRDAEAFAEFFIKKLKPLKEKNEISNLIVSNDKNKINYKI